MEKLKIGTKIKYQSMYDELGCMHNEPIEISATVIWNYLLSNTFEVKTSSGKKETLSYNTAKFKIV